MMPGEYSNDIASELSSNVSDRLQIKQSKPGISELIKYNAKH